MNQTTSLAFIFVLACSISQAEIPSSGKVLFDFADLAAMNGWQVEDDVVMGGRSRGSFTRDKAGHAVFRGEVSLDNNGGFSSVQCYFDPLDVSDYRNAVADFYSSAMLAISKRKFSARPLAIMKRIWAMVSAG